VIAGIAVAVLIAFGLREYALSEIAAVYQDRAAVLSPAPLNDRQLLEAYRIALQDAGVSQRLASSGADALVIHVVPRDWRLADLPIDSEPGRGGHHTPSSFDRSLYKVLFSRARSHDPQASGKEILRSAYGIDPLLLVNVDLAAGKVTAIETPPAHVVWGNIPTPLF
jgi:hypothetical protein